MSSLLIAAAWLTASLTSCSIASGDRATPPQASSVPHGDGLEEEPEVGLRPCSGTSGLCQLNPFSCRLKGKVTPSRNTVERCEFLRLFWQVLSRNRKALGVAGPWGLTLNLRTGLQGNVEVSRTAFPGSPRGCAGVGVSCVSAQREQTESSTPGPGVTQC